MSKHYQENQVVFRRNTDQALRGIVVWSYGKSAEETITNARTPGPEWEVLEVKMWDLPGECRSRGS